MKNEAAKEWLSLARNDLAAAKALQAYPSQARNICFHAQQAGEKALKALYVWRGDSPLKTHDLELLLHRLLGTFPRLMQLEEACSVLTLYAVDARYPGLDVEEEEIEPALVQAETMVNMVADLMGEKIWP